jgi:protein TonB
MFNDLVESSLTKNVTREPWTVAVSVVAQMIFLGILIVIPMLYTHALPKVPADLIMPLPPPAAAPPAIAPPRNTSEPPMPVPSGILTMPTAVPPNVNMVPESAPPELGGAATIGVQGGTQGGSPNGVINSIVGETGATPPPAPAPAPTPQRIRAGGDVQAAKLISQPLPAYPPLARAARVQGNVVLHAIISKDGRVEQLSVISGHPLLIQAALDAVRQWRYQPTLLNNEPVEVDTTITVTFTMGAN